MKKLFYTLHPCEVQIGLMAITAKNSICLAGLRSSCKNEVAPAPELSVFVSMAPAPAPELCFFITWLRLRSSCALLIHFNNFAIPSVLLVASEGVIPIYFELILNTATTTRPA